ncbi:MAG: 4Fe-4S dicluster domain-containing protein [Candidatus Eisenbacteria bacterium]
MASKEDILGIVDAARGKGYAVFAPVKRDNLVFLARVDDTASIDFDHVLTVTSLKDVLLPRCEAVAKLDLDEASAAPPEEAREATLIFGSRPCDAAGASILDAILLGPIGDAHYARRRERTVIVTLACSRSDQACFCWSMGYGPHDPTGSDVLILPAGGRFEVKAITGKGKAFLEGIGFADKDLERGGGSVGAVDAPPTLSRKVEITELKAWLDCNFDSPLWRAVSENCVSCGTCYYLCPTCHCFDIVDETGLSKGDRMRIWDCCSFSGFTKMAGHQPRLGRHARYRQRVMHKFSYCVDNVGKVACVGDGRCIRHCPYGVDICEVLEDLAGGHRKEAGGGSQGTGK